MAARDPETAEPISVARLLWRFITLIYGLAYVVALLFQMLSVIHSLGAPAPLAGVFLVVLGLPWTLAAALFVDSLQPVVAAIAPFVTLLILAGFATFTR
jgi:hypothetical protein